MYDLAPVSTTARSACSYSEASVATDKFTGKERDSETGLDYFGARYYGSNMGRFMSPDEFTGGPVEFWGGTRGRPGPLPYADITNPQSLNKYAYAYNNPLRYIDPDGHKVALSGSAQDQEEEKKRLIANASKKGEAALFKTVVDKNGKTQLVVDKSAAANFKGEHSAGYNLLVGAIGAKQTITVGMSDKDSFTGVPDAQGNVTVNLNRNEAALDRISPLRGYDGQKIPNPFNIIAGHEVLGHAYASDILGLTKGMTYAQEEVWVRQNVENTLRYEQGLPQRDPYSN